MPGFVQTAGTGFILEGRPFPVVGANCYYLGYCPPEAPGMLSSVLDAAEDFGLNTLRIWAFLDLGASSTGVPRNGMLGACFQYYNGTRVIQVDGEDGLERLDRAVAQAAARGLKLILVLVNGQKDLGGMDQYVEWLAGAPGGGAHDDFYVRDELCRAYQDWVRHLLERTNIFTQRKYKEEPAILAWELANEPRCQSPGGQARLLAWVQRMAAFVKSIDTNHLLAVGDEGFFNRRFSCNHLYNGGYGVDCVRLLQSPGIDFGTYHLYPQGWGQTDPAFGARWIRQHGRVAEKAGKPMLLEEFGLEGEPGDRDRRYGEWLRAAGGGLFWMLSGTGPDGQRYIADRRFSIFGPEDAPAVLAFARERPRENAAPPA